MKKKKKASIIYLHCTFMDTELLLFPFPVDSMFSATQMNVPEIDLCMFVKLRVTPV